MKAAAGIRATAVDMGVADAGADELVAVKGLIPNYEKHSIRMKKTRDTR